MGARLNSGIGSRRHPSEVSDGFNGRWPAVRQLDRSPRDARPLPVRVYEQLRDLIVSGELSEDAQLVQEQVAEALGVSRTPVRDALNRLAHEGMVTWIPGRGYLVNKLNERDVVEVYQVRRLLEVEAARLACGHHDRVILSRLNGLIEAMAATDENDTQALFDLNRSFHRVLVEPCNNSQLLKMLDTLWDHPVNRRITRSYMQTAGTPAAMVDEHRALLAAAEAADEPRFLELIAHHLSTGYDDAARALPDASDHPGPGA
jgi:DNA-binding GntR family transcriptional regulator